MLAVKANTASAYSAAVKTIFTDELIQRCHNNGKSHSDNWAVPRITWYLVSDFGKSDPYYGKFNNDHGSSNTKSSFMTTNN